MLIEDLNLIEPIQRALKSEGYTEPTPIQVKAIPELLKGRDLLGCAQTGTGKTAAFALPILQGLVENDEKVKGKRVTKALVVAPTRELAIQISNSFKAYAKNLEIRTVPIYGGVSQKPQEKRLEKGVEVIVATPGRLLDLINQKIISLKHIKYFVLDEADLMLDMGMLKDVKKIITYIPKEKQTMFFSATMPSEIEKLANQILKDPLKVVVSPVSSTVDIIEQEFYYVDRNNKTNLLIHLLTNKDIESALVFSRTKHGANKIVKQLEQNGVMAEAIHGNKSQNARQLALNNFKEKKTRVLVATDIAARGIDIDELSHVINFDLPEVAETYVHRIGRTGRASHGGTAISFCAHAEKPLLISIQKLIGKSIKEIGEHPYPLMDTRAEEKKSNSRRGGSGQGKGRSGENFRRDKKKTDSKKDDPKAEKSWRKYRTNKKKPKL